MIVSMDINKTQNLIELHRQWINRSGLTIKDAGGTGKTAQQLDSPQSHNRVTVFGFDFSKQPFYGWLISFSLPRV